MNTSANSPFAFLVRRRIVFAVSLVIALIALPFLFSFLRPTYVATAHVLMIGNGANGAWMPSTDMSTLATSKTVIERIAARYHLGPNLADVEGRVDAKVPHNSNVMPVSFRAKDKKLALDVTNALADETVAYYKRLSGGQFDEMIAYLQRAAAGERDKVQQIDFELQKAAQSDTYAGSDSAVDATVLRIGVLEQARATAYATLVSDQAIAAAQSAQPREITGIVHQEVLLTNPYVQALRTGEAADAAQLDIQRAKFTDRFPGLPGLEDQVSLEKATLANAEKRAIAGAPTSSASYAASILAKRNALAIASGDQARVNAIDADIAAQRSHLKDLAGTTVSVLRAEREAQKAAYGATIARLTQTRADQAAASSIGSLVVLDHAFEAAPRLPRIAMDIIVTFILLSLTIAIAYVVDVLDPTLRSPQSVEKLYGIPLIGNLGSRR